MDGVDAERRSGGEDGMEGWRRASRDETEKGRMLREGSGLHPPVCPKDNLSPPFP